MENWKKYYDLLGVDINATQEEIRHAYRQKAMKCHPDYGYPKEKFQELQEAYLKILGETERKQQAEESKNDKNDIVRLNNISYEIRELEKKIEDRTFFLELKKVDLQISYKDINIMQSISELKVDNLLSFMRQELKLTKFISIFIPKIAKEIRTRYESEIKEIRKKQDEERIKCENECNSKAREIEEEQKKIDELIFSKKLLEQERETIIQRTYQTNSSNTNVNIPKMM